MAAIEITPARVVVDGKFFRLGNRKFYAKGVAYGPFAPNSRDEMFPEPGQVEKDFQQIRELGANLVRVYYLPPIWFLDLAIKHDLRVQVDVPWPKHLCFLDSEDLQYEAKRAVRQAATHCKGHPALFSFSVVNEIPADIVRWSGPEKVEAFIDELVAEAKSVDPACLCTFSNFPPTEFLCPETVDFFSFNVYLHERTSFENYLARLQMLADDKPLVLGEFGMDGIREGEEHKAEFLAWQIESIFRCGLAGAIIFSYTDDWYRGGMQIQDWAFGLTSRTRKPKKGFETVQAAFRVAPYFKLPRTPKVSVVVASYNGGRTLQVCLDSLIHLNYPDYEVILVDDGSTDNSLVIAKQFPQVRVIAHQKNQGLSVARNTGIQASQGEIVAFTDSDCRADEDWLYYIIGDLLRSSFSGIGGHNFLPPDDSSVAAAVMASPGGPAHVMLTDREAEHIPGCNMAFYKDVLEEIGGFDAIFRKAGDDVDVCWRIQQHQRKIGFSPAGFVWHYRRSTVRAYLNQQRGYGEAEALLARKHPEYFNQIGQSIWRGRIYSTGKHGVFLEHSVIYHGLFGGGFFQKLYAAAPSSALMFCTTLEFHVLVTVPLLVVSVAFPVFLAVGVASLLLTMGVCVAAGAQAELPKSKRRFWSRPLVALLFLLQPIERGMARYKASLTERSHVLTRKRAARLFKSANEFDGSDSLCYWSKGDVDRYSFLRTVLEALEREQWQVRPDSGWTNYDLEIMGSRWSRLKLTTVTEELKQGKLNLRCRLTPHWSLLARILFWSLFGAELATAGLLASIYPWIWFLLVTMGIVFWLLENEQWSVQANVAAVVDEEAECLGLIKIERKMSKKRKPARKASKQKHVPGQAVREENAGIKEST